MYCAEREETLAPASERPETAPTGTSPTGANTSPTGAFELP